MDGVLGVLRSDLEVGVMQRAISSVLALKQKTYL